MLSFFPRGVLDEILNLIESVSEDFPSYSCTMSSLHMYRFNITESAVFVSLMCTLPPENLHSGLSLSSLQQVLCRVAAVNLRKSS